MRTLPVSLIWDRRLHTPRPAWPGLLLVVSLPVSSSFWERPTEIGLWIEILHMLRSNDVAQQLMKDSDICPHIDPVLKYSRQSYVEFLAELHSRGLLRWRRQQEGHQHTLGVFFVTKKDGSLRLIFDTRRANLQFNEPPSTNLQLLLPSPILTPTASVV